MCGLAFELLLCSGLAFHLTLCVGQHFNDYYVWVSVSSNNMCGLAFEISVRFHVEGSCQALCPSAPGMSRAESSMLSAC